MNFSTTILLGLKEIWSHKFRSLLTMLGIILGVSSLVAMSALVKGMENGMKEALVAIGGLEKIRVEPTSELPVYQRYLADQAPGVTMDDVYALEASAPLLSEITPSIEVNGWRERTVLSHGGKIGRPFVFAGTWPDALKLNEHVIQYGRMFNDVDDRQARNVCVIGTGIRDQLFGDPEEIGREIIPIGETILINNQPFVVIGMFQHYESEAARKERLARQAEAAANPAEAEARRKRSRHHGKGGHFVFRLKNNTIYIPLNTMLIKFRAASGPDNTPDRHLTTLNVKIPNIDLLEPALQQARNVLMISHHGIEDFTFRTQEDWAEEINNLIKNARMSRGVIAGICLIVGGIGIMNIMLASISERVREIGIRKAVGATEGDVFIQILVESLVIAMLGGLAGLVVSWVLVHLIASFTPSDNVPVITAVSMLVAFSFSAGVGMLAGLFPAFKASRLHPIQALRYD